MIMIEKYPCKDKLESDARERYWTETLGATLNMNVVGRTLKEYYEDNKDRILEYSKIHYDANKEQILEQNKIWREGHKEQIAEQRKIHYEENKEDILEYHKDYRKNHKKDINKKQTIKYTCECGSINMICNKLRHNKSIKHLNYLSTL
jgi:sulfur relay (sulfurtransferase) DsrC/TusE family protein